MLPGQARAERGCGADYTMLDAKHNADKKNNSHDYYCHGYYFPMLVAELFKLPASE
jgi:hypothetical protein